MTSHSVSGDYLRWLAPQIRSDSDGHPGRTYFGLLDIMFEKEFVELVPNDSNRIGDGLDLRVEFCREINLSRREVAAFLDKEQPHPPCSFLEVLIGLSRRLAFNAGGIPEGWAWTLMNNLTLHRITDPIGRGKFRRARDIMDVCINRQYSPDGVGGFFPLLHPLEDQTRIEIWYQMAAYINEGREG